MDPIRTFEAKSRSDWRQWLTQNNLNERGIWLITYKKSSDKPSLPYGDSVEEALCFGWIDSLPRKLDEERTMLYFAPRKPRTNWSKLNKQRVEMMISAGLMVEAGLAKVEAAKADGSWNAPNGVENLEIPTDLLKALADFENASANFEAFPRSAKRGILEWILNVKLAETRTKRVLETAELASRNLRANQWRDR